MLSIGLPPGAGGRNLMEQSTNAPEVAVLGHTVSPTKLCPTLPVNTTRNYNKLLCSMLYTVARTISINLPAQDILVE
jgi:hypothetical protein